LFKKNNNLTTNANILHFESFCKPLCVAENGEISASDALAWVIPHLKGIKELQNQV
jgi:hypothetical protein